MAYGPRYPEWAISVYVAMGGDFIGQMFRHIVRVRFHEQRIHHYVMHRMLMSVGDGALDIVQPLQSERVAQTMCNAAFLTL